MDLIERLLLRTRTAWGRLDEDERGDVPGWVLITLMTAGLPALTSRGCFALSPVS